MIRLRAKRAPQRPWAPTATGWSESTLAEQAWEASRGAAPRWALWGAALGLLIGAIAFAPASWLARAVGNATSQRLLLADPRGTVWAGSAEVVLSGGPDSRDARSLPGRLQWDLGMRGMGLDLRLRHACCLNGTVGVLLEPGFGRMQATVAAPSGWVGQWPGMLLAGLGTPWNTLQPGGAVRLLTPGMSFESAQGRWRMSGQAEVELLDASSRLATLDTLGSYRLSVIGDGGTAKLSLGTLEGALKLNGSGTWGPGGVRFMGEASADPADEPALNNLLNIIGRRSGARSVISIG